MGLKAYPASEDTYVVKDSGPGFLEWVRNLLGREANCLTCGLSAEPGFCNISDTLNYEIGRHVSRKLYAEFPDDMHGNGQVGYYLNTGITEDRAQEIYRRGMKILKEETAGKKIFRGVKLTIGGEPGEPISGDVQPRVVRCRHFRKV